jgi:hypothetical protein
MYRVISGDIQEKTSTASSGVKGLATVRIDKISTSAICALGDLAAIREASVHKHRYRNPLADAILTIEFEQEEISAVAADMCLTRAVSIRLQKYNSRI